MFAIVQFSNNSTAVIPTSWMLKDDTKCYWPSKNSKNVMEKVKSRSVPNSENWSELDIRCLHKYCECTSNIISITEPVQSDQYY